MVAVAVTLPRALLGAAFALFIVLMPRIAAEEVTSRRAMPTAVSSSADPESKIELDKVSISTKSNKADKENAQDVLELLQNGEIDHDFIDVPKPRPESIINGVATNGPVSHQVGIAYENFGLHCGGSLIHPRVVLTAAHCLYSGDDFIPEYYRPRVQFNMYNMYNMTGVEEIYLDSVELGVDIVVHEDYEPTLLVTPCPNCRFDNDIALLILPYEVGDPNTQYAQINNDPNKPAANEALDVTGWGRTHQDKDDLSDILLKTTLDYVTPDQCKNMWQGGDFITDRMVCARRDGTATCVGDSGGPLVLADTTIQVGIVSWGPVGCTSTYPSGFTRVSSYSSWIKESVCSRIGEFCHSPKQGSSKSRKSKSSKTFSISRQSKSSKKTLSFSN